MTAQKKYVLDYLKSVKTHPSAETVFTDVRKKLPNISCATVYRILNNLKKTGQILSIDTKEMVRFDGDISDHTHFICERCGKVYDIFGKCSKCGFLKKTRVQCGTVKKYSISLYGLCNKCKKTNK